MAASHKTDWFWSDWLADPAVRRLDPDERGVWIDLLALMAAGKPTGYLCDSKGRQIPLGEIARITNCADLEKLAKLLVGIAEKGAASRDRTGRLFNRRMVRDADLSAKRARAGKEGAESRWGQRDTTGTRYDRLKAARARGSHTQDEWDFMQEIFGGCVKCNRPKNELIGHVLTKDHVIPIYQGGSDAIENIQPLCRNCNSGKHKEVADYRELRVPDWRVRLAKRLANTERRGALDPPQTQNLEVGVAREGPLIAADTFALTDRVCAAAGWDRDDPRCVGAPWEVQRWINNRWDGELCVDTVKRLSIGRTVGNLKYFERAIAEAHSNFTKPVPVVVVDQSPEVIRGKANVTEARSLVSAARRAAERVSGDAESSDAPGEPILRLVSKS